jgi:hypothetical protein
MHSTASLDADNRMGTVSIAGVALAGGAGGVIGSSGRLAVGAVMGFG